MNSGALAARPGAPGGLGGRAGPLPDAPPDSVRDWIFEVLVVAAFSLGAWVCLAIARGWPRGKMRRAAAILVWLGCVLLAFRGAAGLMDDLTRAVGLLPDGITGLSLKQTMGTAHPSVSASWSSNATDAYFLAGGLIFGLLAYRYRHSRSSPILPAALVALRDGQVRGNVGLMIPASS